MSDMQEPRAVSKAIQAYEDAMQWNKANLRFVREADELIDLVFNHTNSAMRQRKVAEYLASLVGDEVAAAEATADAERAEFARHAFSHGTSPEPAETIVEDAQRLARELGEGAARALDEPAPRTKPAGRKYVGPWPDQPGKRTDR